MKPPVPVLATPVAELEVPKTPAERVRCHCPRECWANKATLDLVDVDGYSPDYYCLKCAPEPMRSSAEFIVNNRTALGIPDGMPLRVDVEREKVRSPSPHGGNLN